MPTALPWTLPGADDQPILGDTHLPPGGVPLARGVVLLCHGFKGYKDYGFFPRLAGDLAAAGLIAHRFNFSHSGMTRDTDTFARPDLFEADTWSRQVADIVAVAAGLKAKALPGAGLPLILFGHSRGGVAALLAAVELGTTVDGLITAAAPHQACSLDADQRRRLHKTGRLASPSSRTGQTLCVGRAWLEEIEAAPDRFDPVSAITRLTCPVRILHGQDDPTVPFVAAHALCDAPRQPGAQRELILLDNANHTFNAPNPLPMTEDPPPQTRTMIDHTVGFSARCCDLRTNRG